MNQPVQIIFQLESPVMTVDKFCQLTGLKRRTFDKWKSKYRNGEIDRFVPFFKENKENERGTELIDLIALCRQAVEQNDQKMLALLKPKQGRKQGGMR